MRGQSSEKSKHREIHSRPNRTCDLPRKCDSSQVPRTSPRLSFQNDAMPMATGKEGANDVAAP